MIYFSRMIMSTRAMGVVAAFPAGEGTLNLHAILADYGKIASANGVDEAKAVTVVRGAEAWMAVCLY